MKPTEDQVAKVASRAGVEAEIAEVKGYLDIYNQSASEQEEKDRNLLK